VEVVVVQAVMWLEIVLVLLVALAVAEVEIT
jgi:hypothetical protein